MKTLRARVQQAIDECAMLTGTGSHEDVFSAADAVLHRAKPDVIGFLAKAALVDAVRRSQRAETLTVERHDERKPRRGSRAYAEWVETTEEGALEEASFQESIRRRDQGLAAVFMKGLQDYADHLRMEWSAELLRAEFALPSGEVVTWGSATVEQHEIRRDMFAANAVANAEGASRHMAAIRDIRAANARNLEEALAGSAA